MPAEGNVGAEPAVLQAQFAMAADPDSVRGGLQRVLSDETLRSLSDDDRGAAEIVLAEVLNNVVEHAYAEAGGVIVLSVRVKGGVLHCTVEDEGTPMPGGQPPDGLPPDPAELPEGGFGWHLIRSLCHELRYEQVGGKNRLSFSLSGRRSAP